MDTVINVRLVRYQCRHGVHGRDFSAHHRVLCRISLREKVCLIRMRAKIPGIVPFPLHPLCTMTVYRFESVGIIDTEISWGELDDLA